MVYKSVTAAHTLKEKARRVKQQIRATCSSYLLEQFIWCDFVKAFI